MTKRKSIAKTPAQRQADRRERMRRDGYVIVSEWAHIEDAQSLKDAANALRVRRAMGIEYGNVMLSPMRAAKEIAALTVCKFQEVDRLLRTVEPIEDLAMPEPLPNGRRSC